MRSRFRLNHPEVLQCLRDCLFLLWWALRLLGVFRFRLIVVFTLNDAVFLLHLCDIEMADLQSGMLENVFPDFLVGGFALSRSQIQLIHLHFDLDMFLTLEFGQ